MNRTMPRTAKAASSAQNIPQLKLQIPDITQSPFTEAECRSLRRLRSPSSSSSGSASRFHRLPIGGTWKGLLWLVRSFFSHRTRIRVLEGEVVTRWYANPKEIFAVGEDEAFAHLPSVGTYHMAEWPLYSNENIFCFAQFGNFFDPLGFRNLKSACHFHPFR